MKAVIVARSRSSAEGAQRAVCRSSVDIVSYRPPLSPPSAAIDRSMPACPLSRIRRPRPRARVFSLVVDLSGLRAEFPVLSRLAYLNAGTDGPLPAGAARAAAGELTRELEEGRAQAHFDRRRELTDALRFTYAGALACDVQDLALTTCTSEGLAHVIGGLALGPGDETL